MSLPGLRSPLSCWPAAETLGGEVPSQLFLQDPPFADVGDALLWRLD